MKKTVHIVLEDGFIEYAYADFDVDVVVLDLTCEDPEERAQVELEVKKLRATMNEVDVF